MKVKEVPSTPSRLQVRLSLALVMVIMVISSPIVMLVNPALVAARSSPQTTDPTSFSVPSTIAEDGGGDSDFTTQAALSSLTARPTNNIVNTNSFYDVVFLTATAGAIKTIQVTFPAGTTIPSSAFFNEAEKCVPGSNCVVLTGTASKSGQTITYTVTNAVNVPAGTKIRLEFANINNPLNPSANYKVTVTTRNAANTPIDGPTPSTAYTMKQIGVNAIANNAITTPKIADFSVTNSKLGFFSITNDKIANDALSLPVLLSTGPIVNVPAGVIVSATASCLSGEILVGGGINSGADNGFDMRYFDGKSLDLVTWVVRVGNAGSGAMSAQAIAYCIPSSFP